MFYKLTDTTNRCAENGFLKSFYQCLTQDKLCLKLTEIGISGKILGWIKSFLSNRRQRVILGNIEAEWIELMSGWYNAQCQAQSYFQSYFINDLPSKQTNECRLYADDNKIIAQVSCHRDQQIYHNDIKSLDEWSEKWKLSLNFQKYKIMHLGSNLEKGIEV